VIAALWMEEKALTDYASMNRRELIKRAGTLTAAAAGIPLIAACGSSSSSGAKDPLAAARKAKTINVGFANEAPYDFATAAGDLTGEAPAVARTIMKQLGVPSITGVLTEFQSLIPGLQAGRFDVVAAGMFITPERCQQVLFSDPDYAAPEALAVPTGNPKHLQTLQDVAHAGVAVGVLSGAVEGGLAKSAGVSSSNIKEFPDQTSMIEGLTAGRIEAICLTSISLRYAIQTSGHGKVELTTPFFPVVNGTKQVDGGGYAFRKADGSLRDAFNKVLHQLQQSGELLKLVQPFGFGAPEINAAKPLTAAKLCKA
jgi:polar amino acid transport system substrate-binding protein